MEFNDRPVPSYRHLLHAAAWWLLLALLRPALPKFSFFSNFGSNQMVNVK